jgi:hypothetical protein
MITRDAMNLSDEFDLFLASDSDVDLLSLVL